MSRQEFNEMERHLKGGDLASVVTRNEDEPPSNLGLLVQQPVGIEVAADGDTVATEWTRGLY
jgi:hypothetical protein